MIYFRFPWWGQPDMTAWCKTNTTKHMFSVNSLNSITGVWLGKEDAIMFKLMFGIDYETRVADFE